MQGAVIIVPIEINGIGRYDFVVDTGAQVSTVDSSLAAGLHLKSHGGVGVGGAGTYSRTEAVSIDRLRAVDHTVMNSLAVVEDMTQLTPLDRHIRGILGGNFLEHFDILIDNGSVTSRQISFVSPINFVGVGTVPREDGLLPTIAYQRVFISCSGGCASFDPWQVVRVVSEAHLLTA